MKRTRISTQVRTNLDKRFEQLKPVSRYTVPVRGWVTAVRQGLGMSTAQLARRLGVKQPTVVALEQSEARGTIELATLRRAAAALNCTLVYALVPNQSLEETVRERASNFIRRRWQPVEHTMLLEDQSVPARDQAEQLEEILRNTNPRLFWD
jgi:predicted DNA-binding mobile mystery protein A